MVIVINIWQKLSSVERKVTLIITDFWQLLSRIFGETMLIVTNIWRNRVCFAKFLSFPLNHNFFPTVASHLRQASVCCARTCNPA